MLRLSVPHLLAVLSTLVLLVWALPGRSEPPPAAPQQPDEAGVRALLAGKPSKEGSIKLVQMSEGAFPVYEAILADPASPSRQVARIFGILTRVDADRRRFVEHAVQRLADTDGEVRRYALLLLKQIGSPIDIPPIVALLFDKDPTIAYGAATTLLTIGDQRTAVAMNVWLNSDTHRDKEWLRKHVAECRDKLKQRLEKEKKAQN